MVEGKRMIDESRILCQEGNGNGGRKDDDHEK
jgi:hypothetical protein